MGRYIGADGAPHTHFDGPITPASLRPEIDAFYGTQAAEAAWSVLGARYPLAEVPKPTDAPVEDALHELDVVDESTTDAGLTVGQVGDHLARLAKLSRDVTVMHEFETAAQIADAIDTIAGDLQNVLDGAA